MGEPAVQGVSPPASRISRAANSSLVLARTIESRAAAGPSGRWLSRTVDETRRNPISCGSPSFAGSVPSRCRNRHPRRHQGCQLLHDETVGQVRRSVVVGAPTVPASVGVALSPAVIVQEDHHGTWRIRRLEVDGDLSIPRGIDRGRPPVPRQADDDPARPPP